MANLIERLRLAATAASRAFKLTGGIVDPFDRYFGHDDTKYAPGEYGDYLASSNPVYVCATLRADMLSTLKFKAYNEVKGKRVEVIGGPVTTLLRKVNPFWTMNRLQNMSELSMCLWGKNFWAVERGSSTRGMPREIWWMRPDRVTVYPHPVKYIEKFGYQPSWGGDEIFFDPHEVVWFRFPNPLDEFGGLSPLGAARLGADLGSAAAKSNKYLFEQGLQMGGMVTPKEGTTLTPEQAQELELLIDKRFKGVDKAHRWGVLRFEATLNQMAVTPKDAEFLGGLNWSLEEVARAYKVPLDMVGGQRTYENVKASDRALWMRALIPESQFFCSELEEQLLPMFGSAAPKYLEHDLSVVPALQDDASEIWQREEGQIKIGAITVNEWRQSKGLDPVSWGDEPVSPFSLDSGLGGDGEDEAPAAEGAPAPEGERGGRRIQKRGRTIEYGSEEHERLWKRFVRRTEKQEKRFSSVVEGLFESQQESVLARLREAAKESVGEANLRGNGHHRSLEDAAAEPFSLAEWIKKFREKIRPVLRAIVKEAGQDAVDEVKAETSFDVQEPAVVRFLERRAQRFAREVNETTWKRLKDELGAGIEEGEGIVELEERVRSVMQDRIDSTPETIARTEVIGANNGGTLEAWRQAEVVAGKEWLAALDDRTRESHIEAHGQRVKLDEDFEVGEGSGPHPGGIMLPEEDINCRCTMTAVLDIDMEEES